MERIFAAIDKLQDEYGRHGQPIANQTRAFVLVMRYTGMSIGDTAKLAKADVHGNRIRTHRKKTGEDVFGKVPPFVIDALNRAPHDSDQYYFWTGNGLLHTRASKWGDRLQRLFVIASVRTEEIERRRRAGGKLKDKPETVTISKATPHMFRHTLARDLLERGTPMEEIAELLGNSMKVVERYYSKWDVRRQARLERRLEDFWAVTRLRKHWPIRRPTRILPRRRMKTIHHNISRTVRGLRLLYLDDYFRLIEILSQASRSIEVCIDNQLSLDDPKEIVDAKHSAAHGIVDTK